MTRLYYSPVDACGAQSAGTSYGVLSVRRFGSSLAEMGEAVVYAAEVLMRVNNFHRALTISDDVSFKLAEHHESSEQVLAAWWVDLIKSSPHHYWPHAGAFQGRYRFTPG